MSIRVRFAPSPTGNLHVGGLRTALYNYLYAKQHNGKIILRIEDTDQSRKVENAVENLIDSFKILNIKFDEGPGFGGEFGPYFQSERLDIYNNKIKYLLDMGYVYPCFCSSDRLSKLRDKLSSSKSVIKYDRHCLSYSKDEINEKIRSEKYVIRMKIPDRDEVVFYDNIRNKISIKCDEIDDQILIKSDGFPTYHFANVVDDHLMGITHVMRGEEWLPSTPKHILIYEYFNWKLPKFIHLPLLLNHDKTKLSKRQGDVAVEDYIKKGYLPECIINFVALLGWHPKDENEIISITELEKLFSIKRIQKSGAVFDIEKLNWMNSQYLMTMPIDYIVKKAKSFFKDKKINLDNDEKFFKVIDNARNRVNLLSELPNESLMFYNDIIHSAENRQILKTDNSKKILTGFLEFIKNNKVLDIDSIKNTLFDIGKKYNIKGKELFFPVRIALYGDSKGPDIPIIVSILGRSDVIRRLEKLV